MNLNFRILFSLFLASAGLTKAQILIAPVNDGWVTPTYTDTIDYVEVGGNNGEGAMVFSTATTLPYTTFSLEINPYGEPMWVNTIDVYGYSSSSSTFTTSNYGQGTLLGTYTNLSSLGYGQEDLLNITSFVKSVQTNYFGILLSAVGNNEGPDVLSSTRDNYGATSGIIATPEPQVWVLGLLSMGLLAYWRRCVLRP